MLGIMPVYHNDRDASRVPIFPPSSGASMTRNRIVRKDGTTSRYFWTDADKAAPEKTVYKETAEGVKRMKGVHFDATTNRIVKH
jgi:hypothetical protein